jgi:hypothetical protein
MATLQDKQWLFTQVNGERLPRLVWEVWKRLPKRDQAMLRGRLEFGARVNNPLPPEMMAGSFWLTFRLIPPLSLTWAEHFEMEKCFYREDRGIIGKLGTPIRLHQLANNSPNHFHQALLNLNRPLRRIALGGKIV